MRTMLATYYPLSKDSATTPEEMRQKSRAYMLMKPRNTRIQITGIRKGEPTSEVVMVQA